MKATDIVQALGGRRKVIELTGLTKGRISQWEKQNHIPRSWLLAFHALNPEIPFPAQLGADAKTDSSKCM